MRAKTPVRDGVEPIVVSGRFAVLQSEDGGLLFRFADTPAIGLALAPPASDTAATKPAAPASR